MERTVKNYTENLRLRQHSVYSLVNGFLEVSEEKKKAEMSNLFSCRA